MKESEEPIYTFYRLEFNNFQYLGGDYDIVQTLTDIFETMHEMEAELDTPNDQGEPEKSITITGVAMTISEWYQFKLSQIQDED